MTRQFAHALAGEAKRLLSVPATPVQRDGVWFVEVTVDGLPVVLRDGTDLVYLTAELRDQRAA
jgi:hypothetical protein